MVYVNSMFCATRVDEPGKEASVESLWLDVKVGGKDKIRIGAFYRAGNLQNDSQTEVDHKICEEICMNFRPKRIIMGDFNLRGDMKKLWKILWGCATPGRSPNMFERVDRRSLCRISTSMRG